MAINDKIDHENGPRSQQPFECACCDYATNYYNNFMDHINSNHIESDEEGRTFSPKPMNYIYVLVVSYHRKYTDLI